MNHGFPHTIHCFEFGGGNVVTDPLARKIWQRVRPPEMSWYALDLTLNSPTEVRISVFNIRDNFYGGVGEQIHEVTVTEFTESEKKDLDDLVMSLYTTWAGEELERQEEQARQKKIMDMRMKLFGV